MKKVAWPSQMRTADAKTIELGLPGMVLMERAALAVAEHALAMAAPGTHFYILAGGGNNGGDGLAVYRILCEKGVSAHCVLCYPPEKLKGDARAQYDLLINMDQPPQVITDVSQIAPLSHGPILIIDALLGTGLSGPAQGLIRDAIAWINRQEAPVLSVDIPSGVDGVTGQADLAVRAQQTVTFAAYKPGLLLFPGRAYAGKVTVAEIGIPKQLLASLAEVVEDVDIAAWLQPRARDAHKGHFGHVLILAGSVPMPGAALLATNACVRAGAGITTLGIPGGAYPAVAARVPEAMVHPLPECGGYLDAGDLTIIKPLLQRAGVVVMGPGWGRVQDLSKVIEAVANMDIPAVLDADALFWLGRNSHLLKRFAGKTVLTPHPGEMAHLLNKTTKEILADPVSTAREFAARHGVVLVLKGATTIIAAPDGRITFNLTGTPGMSKGGSGDALTGILAALLAQGLSPYDAARTACYLHGKAGQQAAALLGERGMLCHDLIDALPAVMRAACGA